MKLTYENGWYSLENDEIRNFRWSSTISDLIVENTTGFLKFFIGSPENKILKIISLETNDEIILKVRNGWHYYDVTLKGNTLKLITDKFKCEADSRDLGIMLSDVEAIEASPDYLKIENGWYLIENLKSKWIDIVYNLTGTTSAKIQFKTKFNVYDFIGTPNGNQSISFEVKDDDLIDDKLYFKLLSASDSYIKFISVINRNDYYDYFGLKQSKWYDDESKLKEQVANSKMENFPLFIQWFVTWKCNFSCEYCWQEVNSNVYRKIGKNNISAKEWANKFNQLNPKYIYFTGGEPTLYSEFCEMVSLINPNISLFITSNFGKTFNINKWIEYVPKNKFDSVFFSLHPTQVNPKDFFEKLNKYIEYYGVERLGLELVLHPENIKILQDNNITVDNIIDYCNKMKIRLNLDKYYPPHKNKFKLNSTSSNFEEHNYIINNIYINNNLNNGHSPVYCAAGWKKINIDSDGNAFSCMSAIDRSKLFGEHSMPHYHIIGNIFNSDFKLRNKSTICWEHFRCSACDSDTLNIGWENFNVNLKNLPMPK